MLPAASLHHARQHGQGHAHRGQVVHRHGRARPRPARRSCTTLRFGVPALLTSTSSPPKWASAMSGHGLQRPEVGQVGGPRGGPRARRRRRTRRRPLPVGPRAGPRSPRRAPCAARATAVAAPMPEEAPVRSAERSGSSRDTRVHGPHTAGLVAAGHLDRLVGDDVLLHLGGAGADRGVPLEHVEPVPRPAVHGVLGPLGVERVGAQQVDGQLGEGLGQVAPLQLRQGHLGPVLLVAEDLRQGPVVEQLGVLDAGVGVRDALPHGRVPQGVGVDRTGQVDHGVEVGAHADGQARGADPLGAQGAHRHEPALALAAEPVGDRDPGVVEHHRAEHLLAGDVADGGDGDARRARGR